MLSTYSRAAGSPGSTQIWRAMAAHPFRVLLRDVIGRERRVRIARGAERIDPRVQLDAARMRFRDCELERIVAGIHALRCR